MKTVQLFFLSVALFWSCDSGTGGIMSSGGKINNKNMEEYLALYQRLRQEKPEDLEQINDNSSDFDRNGVEAIIRGAGFKNFEEFDAMNKKVSLIYMTMSTPEVLESFKEAETNSTEAMDELAAHLQELIDDPNTSEADKTGYRASLKELSQGKKSMNAMGKDFEQRFAKAAVKLAKKRGQLGISEADAQWVARYREQIAQAYKGFPLPNPGTEENIGDDPQTIEED